MEDYIKEIQNKNYNNTELIKIIEREYNHSKTIRQDLSGQFKEVTDLILDYDEEYDIGLYSLFTMTKIGISYIGFRDDILDNQEERNCPLWDFALENCLNGWEMQRAYWSFRAHKQVLESNLLKMNYEYND